ncbi:MAG: 50S ribosomal protein L11 methyltransferase [Syntrophomonadaceae bacterium]|nr:50S ribosomal protein L11 methyltransferase [Syntrophomonadaceae bacterium]
MKWKEVSVIAEPPCAEAIAGFFHQLGCGGVVIEDPHLARQHIENGDWDAHELPPHFLDQEFIVVKAYFPEGRDVSHRVLAGLKKVEENFSTECRLLITDVNEEDWAQSWKEYYHTLTVGERLVIKPSWEEYQPRQNEVVIEMDPGMAFGTGTHVTTRFCLEFLEKYIRGGEKVADVGTGSGILAIAAAKLGAASVIAIEVDELAARVARENVERNQVQDRVEVLNLNFLYEYEEEVDFLVANLTAELIQLMVPKVCRMLHKNGYFLVSGVIASKLPVIQEVLGSHGLLLEELREDEDWLGIVARKG